MSTSTLWTMNENFEGEVLEEFSNSHLLTPMAWEILFNKYLSRTGFSSVAEFDESIPRELNEKINNSTIEEDRIVWELTKQQVFFTKDKVLVADAIKRFLSVNKLFTGNLGTHIHERFQEVANEILKLDEQKQPYFIFKNTSVDDGVQCWFYGYDIEKGKCVSRTLKDIKENVAEFVIFENNQIKEWVTNIELLHTN